MMRYPLLLLLLLSGSSTLFAQSNGGLSPQEIAIVEMLDIYGQPVQSAQGTLLNDSEDAYGSISLSAQAFDAGDELVAEGFGVLVNACGAGLAFDFVLAPGDARPFAVPLELFADDVTIERVEVSVSAEALPADALPVEAPLAAGIRLVSEQEVVAVEWEDSDTLRYAVGCERDLFTDWSWYRYDLDNETTRAIEHPAASAVTDDLRALLRLEDPLIFQNSRLRFAPISGERLVYQDRVNTVFTAAADGRFQRQLHLGLNSYSLQGYIWLPEDRFMAYYYGAFGDEVIYFTADVQGRFISRPPLQGKPSRIVPGVSADGERAIIAGTIDDETGYFIDILDQRFTELLFAAEPPGNNYPPPVPLLNEEGDRVTQIYLIRPVDGEDRLQCFSRPAEGEGENQLIDLAAAPLRLAVDERAWSFLSPDEGTIGLSANGVNSGLWLIDLQALPACGA
jgi:hypothetical protein